MTKFKSKYIFVLIFVILILIIGGNLIFSGIGQKKEEKSEKSRESSVEEMTPDEVIHAFGELMYT